MMIPAFQARGWQQLGACLLAVCLVAPRPATAVTKMKFRGYITARVDDRTVAIMDDKLELTAASRSMARPICRKNLEKPARFPEGRQGH